MAINVFSDDDRDGLWKHGLAVASQARSTVDKRSYFAACEQLELFSDELRELDA